MTTLSNKLTLGLSEVESVLGRRPTIWLTNQIRYKIGVMFGNPETMAGGEALKFLCSTIVRTAAGKTHVDNDTGVPLIQEFRLKVTKNKVSVPKVEAEYDMVLVATDHKGKGAIADEGFVFEQAKRLGIITKNGGGWICFDERHASQSAIEEKMMTDPEWNQKLRAVVMEVLLKSIA